VRSLYLGDLKIVALDGEPLSAIKRAESLLWCGLSPPFETSFKNKDRELSQLDLPHFSDL